MTTHQRETLAHWTDRLTGLPPEWVLPALERVESWGLGHVSAELLADNVDAAAAATLLCRSLDELADRGIPPERWIKKLRRDKTVWPTWAEVRVASILARSHYTDAEAELEAGRGTGAHADLRFIGPGAPQSVEIKSVGLSDEEASFCRRMAPSLPRVLPKIGIGHVHAPIDGQPPRNVGALRRHGKRVAARGARTVPGYPPGLRAAVIVGHGSEDAYTRRVASRVVDAVRQLPAGDQCWVAIYWSNGAPIAGVHDAIDWSRIPGRVAGLHIVGQGVAFPHPQIHAFSAALPRPAVGDLSAELAVFSQEPGQHELAAVILGRFESSSGVRATLVRVGSRDLVVRDGTRRILPYNLLMDADAEEAARADPTPVQIHEASTHDAGEAD